MHSYLVEMKNNPINIFLWEFLGRVEKKWKADWSLELNLEGEEGHVVLTGRTNSSNNHSGYFEMS